MPAIVKRGWNPIGQNVRCDENEYAQNIMVFIYNLNTSLIIFENIY